MTSGDAGRFFSSGVARAWRNCIFCALAGWGAFIHPTASNAEPFFLGIRMPDGRVKNACFAPVTVLGLKSATLALFEPFIAVTSSKHDNS